MARHATSPARAGEVLSYERISRFRVDQPGIGGEFSRGVDRQTTDADTCAEAMGLGTVEHFPDEGKSASRFATKERTKWLELIDRIRAGGVSHVLFWVVDRALRQSEDMCGRTVGNCGL